MFTCVQNRVKLDLIRIYKVYKKQTCKQFVERLEKINEYVYSRNIDF